jgi:hypothetical protein
VQYQVDRLVGWCQPDGAQNGFGILDVDVTRNRHPKYARAFLPVYQCDYPGFAFDLKLFQQLIAKGLLGVGSSRECDHYQDEQQHPEKKPRDIRKREPDTVGALNSHGRVQS